MHEKEEGEPRQEEENPSFKQTKGCLGQVVYLM